MKFFNQERGYAYRASKRELSLLESTYLSVKFKILKDPFSHHHISLPLIR
jgi:hypothetical protein